VAKRFCSTPPERLFHNVASDEGRGVEGTFLLAPGFRLLFIDREAAGFEGVAKAFQVGDGLLEDVAQNVHVDHGPNGGALVFFGHFARGPVLVVAEVLEMGADVVRHLKAVQSRIGGETNGLEALVGVLVGAFVIEARLPHGGNDDPVAREIDGVAIGLVHGGHTPAGERTVERIACALAFKGNGELDRVPAEPTEDGVGKFAIHLDVALAGKGVGLCWAGGASVAEEVAEDVGDEIGEQAGFLELVGTAGSD